MVVQSGATLTIESGVTVTVDTSLPDPVPYPGSLSNKIEIIVENGGALVVNGATLTEGSATAGAWYGVVFLTGSSGSVTGATIQDASPNITGTRIEYLSGNDGANSSWDGGDAIGIKITGTTTSQIQGNTIRSINGGSGAAGDDASSPGTSGSNGGRGGQAIGITVAGASAEPTPSGNTIEYWGGGSGGEGGDGGNGANGSFDSGDGTGEDGGLAGDGTDAQVNVKFARAFIVRRKIEFRHSTTLLVSLLIQKAAAQVRFGGKIKDLPDINGRFGLALGARDGLALGGGYCLAPGYGYLQLLDGARYPVYDSIKSQFCEG